MIKGEIQQWIWFASEIWNLFLQQLAGRFRIWECGLLEFEYGKKHGLCERLNIGIVALWH